MSIKSSLLKWEKEIKEKEKQLGEELTKIHVPKSLFGKHSYAIEQPILKFVGFEVQRAASLVDPELAVGYPPMYSEDERGKLSKMMFVRARDILEKRVGV
jgi:hypothetical protein